MKKKLCIALLLLALSAMMLSAQSDRSWFVKRDGNDDNNGRSEENAFRSLKKAFASAASSNVKTITVIGSISAYGDTPNEGTGEVEILLKGLDENAKLTSGTFQIHGASKVRLENIIFVNYDSILRVFDNASVIVGKDARFEKSGGISINDRAELTLESNAYINGSGVGIYINGGTVLMKDNAVITGCQYTGVEIQNSGSFTMQDNAKITGCKSSGVFLNQHSVFTMKGSSSISENNTRNKSPESDIHRDSDGAGIFMNYTGNYYDRVFIGGEISKSGIGPYPIVTLQDKASITGNTAGGRGGGIFMGSGQLIIKDNAVISGNKAKKGGGIYYGPEGNSIVGQKNAEHLTQYLGSEVTGNWDNYMSSNYIGQGKAPPGLDKIFIGYPALLTIQGSALITNNQASEGGGVYAVQGTSGAVIEYKYVKGRNRPFTPDFNNAKFTFHATGITMSGGSISGNKADYGAGVYAAGTASYQPITLNTSVSTQKESWVFTLGNAAVAPAFTLSGGSITNNEAEFVGGGVYEKVKNAFNKASGTLSGNKAGDGEGEDIYQQK